MSPKTRYRSCVICGVRAHRRENEKRKFMARFPLNPDRCRQWVKNIGNEDLAYIPIQKLHEAKFVCGDHFLPSCFNRKKSRLKKQSIPSLGINAQPLSDHLLVDFPCHIFESSEVPAISHIEIDIEQKSDVLPNQGRVLMDLTNIPEALNVDVNIHQQNIPGMSGAKSAAIIAPDHVMLDHNYHLTKDIKPNEEAMKRPMSAEQKSDVLPNQDCVLIDLTNIPDALNVDVNADRKNIPGMPGAKSEALIRPNHIMLDHNYHLTKDIKPNEVAMNCPMSTDATVSPQQKKLLQKLKQNKLTIKTLQKKAKILDSIESPVLKTLITSTVKNQKRKQQAKRWSNSDKGLALSIYKKSPKVYRFLRHLLPLPSIRTLQMVLQRMTLETGINEELLGHLKKASAGMNVQDKICVILFDEMALKKRLILNTTTDKIDGFQDLGDEGGRSAHIADHTLVFMLQGVRKKYKQPLAHYFVKGTVSSEKLSIIIKTIIRRVIELEFLVIATVCDQGPTNVGALNLLKRFSGISIDTNYFLIDETKIFTLYDVPHLFKSLRNNFLQGGEVLWDNKKGKWKHLIQLEEKNRNTLHFTKISKRAVLPKYKSKMKVKLAAQILSNTVSAILKLQAESADGDAKKEIMQTAEVIEDFDQLFDCTNGPASYKDIKKNIRENVSKTSFHHEKWRTYKEKLRSLKFLKSNSNVTLKNVRCVKGYIISICSLQDIWNFVSAKGLKYLNLRQLNQDSLENLFGLIRQHSPTNRNPTCYHFSSALKSSILTRLSTPALRGANCEQDNNQIIFDFHDIVFQNKKEVGETLNDERQELPRLISTENVQVQELSQPMSAEDDMPVLHFTEDFDDDEHLVNFDKQPAVYVSGFVAKKILNGLTCSRCCSAFQADEQSRNTDEYKYIYLREWDKNDIRLTYPSKALCNQIILLTKVFDENIKTMLYVSGVIQYSKTMMLGSLDMSWLCPEHFADCAEKLVLMFSILLLRNECRRQNEAFSLAEDSTADLLKRAEQTGSAK